MGPNQHRRHRVGIAAGIVVALLGILTAAGSGSDDATAVEAGGSAGATSTSRATSTSTSTSTTSTSSTTTTTTVPTTLPPTTAAPPTTGTAAPPTAPATTGAPAPTNPPTTTAAPPPTPPPAPPAGGSLCIGDSVMLGAGPQYQNTLSMCAEVNAVESRQMHEADDMLAYYGAVRGLPPVVVIGLGNNGSITSGEIDEAMAQLTGVAEVVFVTIELSHTREWQDQVNGEIRAAAARYPGQVRIADWEAASNGHPEYFGSDGIHIVSNPTGAHAYADTIAAAI